MDGGLYLLLLRLRSQERVTVGALGSFVIEPGWYVYAGSARRYLRQRIARHLAPMKQVRWHIDYLTMLEAISAVGAVLVQDATECALNQKVGHIAGTTTPIPGFGSSDCKERCPAHLWFSDDQIALPELARQCDHLATNIVTAADAPWKAAIRGRDVTKTS